LDWLRSTRSFAPPACLGIFRCCIWTSKTAIREVLTDHRLVSFRRSFHCLMTRTLNTPLHLFSDFSLGCLDQILRFLCCGALKPSILHFGYMQCKAHVGLFELHPTSFPCHCCRHDDNLQPISCSI
jgi:hypothetical protein